MHLQHKKVLVCSVLNFGNSLLCYPKIFYINYYTIIASLSMEDPVIVGLRLDETKLILAVLMNTRTKSDLEIEYLNVQGELFTLITTHGFSFVT